MFEINLTTNIYHKFALGFVIIMCTFVIKNSSKCTEFNNWSFQMSNEIRDSRYSKREVFANFFKKAAPIAALVAVFSSMAIDDIIEKTHAFETQNDSQRNYLINKGCDVSDYDRGGVANCNATKISVLTAD